MLLGDPALLASQRTRAWYLPSPPVPSQDKVLLVFLPLFLKQYFAGISC